MLRGSCGIVNALICNNWWINQLFLVIFKAKLTIELQNVVLSVRQEIFDRSGLRVFDTSLVPLTSKFCQVIFGLLDVLTIASDP